MSAMHHSKNEADRQLRFGGRREAAADTRARTAVACGKAYSGSNVALSAPAPCGERRATVVPRPGVGLVELVASMSLAGLIAVLATALILGQARLIASGTLRAEALDAMRTAALLMPMEARSLAASDIHAISSDSAAFRAFRGSGIACQVQGARATLRYRGWRDMDATKDSVVILTRVPERAVAISSVGPASGTCTALGGEILLDVALAGDTLLAGDAVLVFEAGAYHLTTGALRYRAPGGSRQPLTADVVAGTGFGIVRRAPPGLSEPLAIELGLAPIPRNALTQPTLSAGTVKVSLLNVSAPPDSTE